MRSCVADRRTDGQTSEGRVDLKYGQTDGAGYTGPAEGYGGSKKRGLCNTIYVNCGFLIF